MTAPARSQRLLVCNCQRTMEIDGRRLAEALGLPEALPVHTELCRSQMAAFEAGLTPGATVHVACTQEAPLFREVAAEKGEADLAFTNIRERAGWCADKPAALPKMAALLGRGGPHAASHRRHHAEIGRRVPRLRPWPGRPRCRRRALRAPQRHGPPQRPGGGPAARHRRGADLQGPHPHGDRASRRLRDRGRRLRADAALLQGRARVRHAAQRRALHLRHHLRHVRRHTPVRRCAASRRLSPHRPEPPRRRRARHVQGHRSHRRVRETALCQLRRRHLRACPQPEGRLHQLPRHLPHRRHHA